MIAGCYARKSTEQHVADDAKSVSRQVQRAREYAVAKGWRFDEKFVFTDDAVSGAEFRKRPGLNKLLESLQPKPKFNVLIISEPSRLGREQIETAYILKQIVDADVRVFAYLDDKEIALGSALEKFVASVQHFSAESERESGSKRVRDKMQQLAEKGLPTGNRVYGYEVVKGVRSIKPSEAAVVQQIFELRSQGLGHYRIARALERDGHLTPRGKTAWGLTQVGAILVNELYHGWLVWGRRRRIKKKGTSVIVKSPESIVRTEVPALAIVSEALWQQAQEVNRLAREACWRAPDGTLKSRPTVGKGVHLLTPILACGVCQGPMHFRRDTKKREYLICSNLHRYGKRKCTNGTQLPVAWAERAIIGKFEEALCADVVLKKVQEVLDAQRANQEDPEPLKVEAAALHAQITRLVDLAARGAEDDVDVLDGIRTRKAKLATIEARLAGIGATDGLDLTAFTTEITAVLKDLTLHLRKHPSTAQQVLRRICPTRITVTPTPGGGWLLDGNVDYKEVLKTTGFTAAKVAIEQLTQLSKTDRRCGR